jgi:hypothetical protein
LILCWYRSVHLLTERRSFCFTSYCLFQSTNNQIGYKQNQVSPAFEDSRLMIDEQSNAEKPLNRWVDTCHILMQSRQSNIYWVSCYVFLTN